MTKVIVSEDCGNSPKNKFLEKLTTAFAKGDAKFILSKVTDDIYWNIVGKKLIQGKDDFVEALERMTNDKAEELTISHYARQSRRCGWHTKIEKWGNTRFL